MNHSLAKEELVELLSDLIKIPSFSREEKGTGDLLESFFLSHGFNPIRIGNNIVVKEANRTHLPEVWLCSHHDTVQPNSEYTMDPFLPIQEEGKLFGLGSNDAGAALISLIGAFLEALQWDNRPYQLVLAAVAEEEVSGQGGLEAILHLVAPDAMAIIGEPTSMQCVVAERGLLVLDCLVKGVPAHVANNNGINAIEKALPDLFWFTNYQWPDLSPWLGPVTMQVTMIQAGTQHNVLPGTCKFTVDIRLNECYSHETILETIRANVRAEVTPRSTRLKPSLIDQEHALVRAAKALGWPLAGSQTLSDQSIWPYASVKIGPGDTLRSHTANEFIYLEELEQGRAGYISFLKSLMLQL